MLPGLAISSRAASATTVDPLCFTADGEDSSFKLTKVGMPPEVSVEYSRDQVNWTLLGIDTDTVDIPNGTSVYLRAVGTNIGFGSVEGEVYPTVVRPFKPPVPPPPQISNYNFVMTGKIKASGDITTLLDKHGTNTVSAYCYYSMFKGCTSLTTAPELPATTLASNCYSYMFSVCTSLTTAPALPATKLAEECYAYMFNECANLTAAPVLPATTLAYRCYASMFHYCPGLTQVPAELPATTLAEHCYANMFSACTSLTTAPELPATTLADGCYYFMFYGCTRLTATPRLPATQLTENCYEYMFYRCTSLINAPELPATTLTSNCYFHMFEGCTHLTTAPVLSATTLAKACYSNMFSGCTSLTTAPALPATELATACYYSMFQGCSSITTSPDLDASSIAEHCYCGMFEGCVGLKLGPEILPATELKDYCYYDMFEGCTSLTVAPVLPARTLVNGCYGEMFAGCTCLSNLTVGLTAWDTALDATTDWLAGVSALGTFTKPEALPVLHDDSAIPEAWSIAGGYLCFTADGVDSSVRLVIGNGTPTTPFAIEYSYDKQDWHPLAVDGDSVPLQADTCIWLRAAAAGNISASDFGSDYYSFELAGAIRASGDLTTLLDPDGTFVVPANGLGSLFYQCSALVQAPQLPAIVLGEWCYGLLFAGTSITDAPVLPARRIRAQGVYCAMFQRCAQLHSGPSLPATTLATGCYQLMFGHCSSLTEAPALPATELANICYRGMFKGCTGLTAAPELPATELARTCYDSMFNGCTQLASIKVAFTDWRTSDIFRDPCTTEWVSGVAASGVFTKPAALSATRGTSWIPSGWEVVNV